MDIDTFADKLKANADAFHAAIDAGVQKDVDDCAESMKILLTALSQKGVYSVSLSEFESYKDRYEKYRQLNKLPMFVNKMHNYLRNVLGLKIDNTRLYWSD